MLFVEKIAASLIALILLFAAAASGATRFPLGENATVTAAIVTAMAGMLTLLVNANMTLKQHREKIRADTEIAERRFRFDRDLALLKVETEHSLRLASRRAEFAEAALRDVYDVRARIIEIREPGRYGSEGEDRPGREAEDEETRAWRDNYYPTIRRFNASRGFFNEFYARRFTALALFGAEGEAPYSSIWDVLNRVLLAAHQLAGASPGTATHFVRTQSFDRYRGWIWATHDTDDEIMSLMNSAIEQAERVMRPALMAASQHAPS